MHGRSSAIYSHVKGCILEGVPIMGVRVVGYTVHPDGSGTSSPESTRLVVLTEPGTGRLLAIIDEHWTYAVRTTAAAVIGAKYPARPDTRAVGVIGAGALARTGLMALAETFRLTRVAVTSRRRESFEGFAREMSAELGITVTPCDSIEAACAGAEVILVSTTAGKPVVQERWVPQGACVISIGRDELEHALFAAVDKIVVDERREVLRSLGPVIAEGHLTEERIHAEIQDVVAKHRPGREHPDERILIKTVGLVSQDVAVAYRTYEKAVAAGREIPLA
jgi:ornithine cyclodeaminase/alanine dehydrogenase-like protein (mu-crystallin family)